MEIYKVEWQLQAKVDLINIRSYLVEQDALTTILKTITKKANDLFYFPARYRKIKSKSDLRLLVVKDYSVFYRIIEHKKLVQIMHVWHHSKDIRKLVY